MPISREPVNSFKSLPATQAKMSCLTAPSQLGLQVVQTREVSGGVYQAVSRCGIHLLILSMLFNLMLKLNILMFFLAFGKKSQHF